MRTCRVIAALILGLGCAGLASGAVLEQTAPSPTSYVQGTDFNVMTFSATGDVTALVTAVDLQPFIGNLNTSGCEAADFAGFPAGNIALLQRGTCLFELKAENAAAAGAVGVLIFNSGITSSFLDIFTGTLTENYTGGIPVMSLPFNLGVEFSQTPGLEMHMQVTAQDLVTVPEPATLALLGLGLLGLGFARRRKARTNVA